MTITSRRTDNTSVTLINANESIINQRMSTFEPYQIMRDTVQQFCEKHFTSIKVYMDKLSQRLPPPLKCGIEGKIIYSFNLRRCPIRVQIIFYLSLSKSDALS